MLGPSPDWIVGVSSLELCLRNCSWASEKVVDLYLWDAGTDSGISYLSPNTPTIPRERIRRITPNYPESPESPFYDPNNNWMKPFAKLTVTRQRMYEKPCEEDNDIGVNRNPESIIQEDPRGMCLLFIPPLLLCVNEIISFFTAFFFLFVICLNDHMRCGTHTLFAMMLFTSHNEPVTASLSKFFSQNVSDRDKVICRPFVHHRVVFLQIPCAMREANVAGCGQGASIFSCIREENVRDMSLWG
jgi:hypothetical protein